MSALICCNRRPRLRGAMCCGFVAILAGLAAPVRADSLNVFLLERAGSWDSQDPVVGPRVGERGALLSAAFPELGVFDLGSGGILARWFSPNSTGNIAVLDSTSGNGSSSLNAVGFDGSSRGSGRAAFDGAPSTSNSEVAIRFGATGVGFDSAPSASLELTQLGSGGFINDRFAQVTGIGGGGGGGSSSDTPPPIVPTPTAALGGLALLGALAIGRRRYRTV